MLTKKEFAAQVRVWVHREPTKEEWVDMWTAYEKNPNSSLQYLVSVTVSIPVQERVFPEDMRIIPPKHRRSAASLSEVAAFARAMQEKFQ